MNLKGSSQHTARSSHSKQQEAGKVAGDQQQVTQAGSRQPQTDLTCHKTAIYEPAKACVRPSSAFVEGPEPVHRMPLPLVISGPPLSLPRSTRLGDSTAHDAVGGKKPMRIDDAHPTSSFFRCLPGADRRIRDSARRGARDCRSTPPPQMREVRAVLRNGGVWGVP